MIDGAICQASCEQRPSSQAMSKADVLHSLRRALRHTWAHMGGLTLARARIAEGTLQTPSPAIRADATKGAEIRASAGAKYCQIPRMMAPIVMSTQK